MLQAAAIHVAPPKRSLLDRSLALFTDIRAGEGATAVLMLVNIFLLLICYSVIKTVREPLILLGGGAEVRSYAAAGQALVLMGFVPLYSWFASKVNRTKLLVSITAFFIVCIELFALGVAAKMPYIGVAFFVWVGIFNVSLVAQFWSFANDVYTKEAGERLFPMIAIGMTAGAPLGSFVAARLFRLGFTPQIILQISAFLLALSAALYLGINRREATRTRVVPAPLSAEGGFWLVLRSPYLRLVAALVVLLNVVNTTGEYLVAKLLTLHVTDLALVDPLFNKQAYIGAFSGEYQFWVNVTAFVIQAFVTSRLVKHTGLRGALLALPLIALGGYGIVAAGAGFSIVRWIKTAENATDYSIMNTARQLLWLRTSREEKYKAKQAIDTFFVRGGDVLSAGVVYLGTHALQLTISQFAVANMVLTGVWLGVALMILRPAMRVPRVSLPVAAPRIAAAAGVALAAAVALSLHP
jgi:AAA family ATP:ADP antiporter